MIIGAMNHPARDVIQEIEWMAAMKLDFIDLTLEPPSGATWVIKPAEIRSALDAHGMKIVGHTAYYLPICHPFESVRRGAVEELRRCLETFSKIGARWMNIHPDRHAPMHDRRFIIEQNIRSLEELAPTARDCGVGLMIENLPGDFNSAAQLGEILDRLSEIGLHLDIGHSNLMAPKNTACEILSAYSKRLKHVHLHDNKGGSADLHLPLGAGTLDVPAEVRRLKATGYDGTITLEVFSHDRHFLGYSRDRLREIWDES